MKNYKKGSLLVGAAIAIVAVGILIIGYTTIKYIKKDEAHLSTQDVSMDDVTEPLDAEDYEYNGDQYDEYELSSTTTGTASSAVLKIPVVKPTVQAEVKTQAPQTPQATTGSYASVKAEYIKQIVSDVSANTTYPYKASETVTVLNIGAEPSAIHYYYQIDAVAPDTQITNETIKQSLLIRICPSSGTHDAKSLLEENINLIYSYWIPDLHKNLQATITKADCE